MQVSGLFIASKDTGVADKKTVGKSGTSLFTVDCYSKPSKKDAPIEYYRLAIWGGIGDALANQGVKKGDLLFVTGEIELQKYTTKDGEERLSRQISINNFSQYTNCTQYVSRKLGLDSDGDGEADVSSHSVAGNAEALSDDIPF